jgi:asparagine synthase (glutamine-hydrolysing)
MCGICGLYNYRNREPADTGLVRSMVASIIHRGPDDNGFYFNGPVALGMCRLSIIDLSGGAQPISDEAGRSWIVFNGEIYNFQDLRKELEGHGHTFKSHSDTETIVHAYEQWGVEALDRLNGMFALALWDDTRQQMVLARDPFGIKPLYYWDDGRGLVFGSEIKAILCHPQIKREVDLRALDEFLTLSFVPSPQTAFAGIKKLLPGHALIFDSNGGRLYRFRRRVPKTLTQPCEEDLVEALREKITAAVKRQMVADVPIGAMLSGGVDSSTIATLMAELSGDPIKTFTVGFEKPFAQNELEHARSMAKRIGSDHHEVVVSASDWAEFMPRSIWYLEEPVATASTLAFYKVCELARQHVKVVLTGQGADEPFAGYPRHLGEFYGRWYRSLPRFVRERLIAPWVELLPRNEQLKRAVRSLGIDDPLKRMLAVYTIIDKPFKLRLYRDDLLQSCNDFNSVRLWQSDVTDLDPLSQMLYVDARLSLSDNLLIYGDKMAMAVSLEARVPFLDLELMDFAESIPASLKIKGRSQKHILKKAVSKWTAPEVLTRKKVGFATPVDQWMRRELSAQTEERLLSPGSACREFFRAETVRKMLEDHRRGRQDYKRALFSLLTFELWHEQFIKPHSWRKTSAQ